jgi:transposase
MDQRIGATVVQCKGPQMHTKRFSDGVMRLTASQLAALLDGMDWSRLHMRDVARPTATS